MKIYPGVIYILCFFISLACSKDDVAPEESSPPQINFVTIGEDTERVYQYTYDSNSESGAQIDLTQETGIGNDYITLRQEDDVISFYSFAFGKFSLVQKNVETGTSTLTSNFYTESDERSILWGTNDNQHIYLGFFDGFETSNFGVLTISIATGEEMELMIEDNIKTSYQPIYYQGKLLLTYLDGSDDYNITVVDIATNSIQKQLEFGKLVPNVLFDDLGDVVVLRSESGVNYSYQVYDSESFELKKTVDFSLTRYFAPGAFGGRFTDERLFYYGLYVQPAAVRFGPAIYDFRTNEETLWDMEQIVADFEAETGQGIVLISQGYDQTSQSYLVGFANLNDGSMLDGGVFIISFEGKLLQTVELPFVPTFFLTDN